MPNHATEAIRNLALVGHSSAGKTTFLEALLAAAKTIATPGTVERGNTVADFDPMEKEHQHSLDSAVTHLYVKDVLLNVLDTPGYPDFRGPTLTAMAAVETVAVVIDATSGVEFNTQRLMTRAKQRRLCRMIVINKIDAEEIDLEQLVLDIRENFGDECLPINLPAENGTSVTDVFFNPQGAADILSVANAHTEITDQVVEMDEDLMETYLEQGKLEPTQLHDAFERALREGHLVPICFVSARTGVGVSEFLELCTKLLPNPLEGNPPPFLIGEGASSEIVNTTQSADQHVLAHVFKITNDPFVGKLSVFRVYQGTLTTNTQLFIGDGRKPFKVGHLFKVQGKDHIEVDRVVTGDIAAVAKVDDIHYDAVLHDSHEERRYHLKPLDFPQPMFGLAIEAKSRGQEQKLSLSLHKLAEEDPCFEIEHSIELNETVIRGLGDLHLRIMLERMEKRYNVEVNTRPPRVAYRETITVHAEGHYRHKKQTGGAGQFGEVYLRVEPLTRGSGFEFHNKVVGGTIPTGLIPAVEKGVRQLMAEGAVAGYPLQDIAVTVYDGKHHAVDSKEIAFVVAGRKAFQAAIAKAKPQLLEPIVNVKVTVPDGQMGDIAGSLASKRARINGTNSLRGGLLVIDAEAPLSELSDFQTELKALTGGKGRYTMDFSHYDPVPRDIQRNMQEAFKPEDAE